MGLIKSARRQNRIQALQAEIIALKGLIDLQKSTISQHTELIKTLVERLAGLGIKVKLVNGEIQFEATTIVGH